MASHVLVAVGGSEHSDRAVDFAVRYGTDLAVLNVVSYPSTVPLSLGDRSGLLPGSVSHRVAHPADCAVITVT